MAQKSAHPLWLHDIAAAFGLLTRLPIKVDSDLAVARGAKAAWAYPLVGFGLGTLLFCLFIVLGTLHIPLLVSCILIVAVLIVITGAMHEDGLADSADGLWGGWTVERRLEIMKDSAIGVYGVCAIVLVVMLRIAAFASVSATEWIALMLIAGAGLSRAAMVVVMYRLPHARGGGLSQSVGRPPARTMWVALGLGIGGTLVAGLILGQLWAACLMILATAFATLACMAIAKRKIQGQTGDILGATQQISEVAALIAASTVLIGGPY